MFFAKYLLYLITKNVSMRVLLLVVVECLIDSGGDGFGGGGCCCYFCLSHEIKKHTMNLVCEADDFRKYRKWGN